MLLFSVFVLPRTTRRVLKSREADQTGTQVWNLISNSSHSMLLLMQQQQQHTAHDTTQREITITNNSSARVLHTKHKVQTYNFEA